jgi:N-acetylglucosamine-6-phosphate deacetylase
MNQHSHLVITGARVVTPQSVFHGSIEIKDGRIVRVGNFSAEQTAGARALEFPSCYILPGLIDMHVNDGQSILLGLSSAEEHADRLADLSRGLINRGITGIFLATLAGPLKEIKNYLEGMALFNSRWKQALSGTEICGALVEGTFMNPDNCGAHNPAYIYRPERKILDSLIETGAVRVVNIAPEYGQDSLDLISYAVDRGLVAAAGHCKPTAEQLARAVDCGLSYFIHLLNGPTGSNTKAFNGGGTVEGALRDDRLAVELIADFVHVARPVLRDVIARKEPERVVTVSDSMFPSDAPEAEFEINGILGMVHRESNYISVVGRRDDQGRVRKTARSELETCDATTLYGSAVNMDTVFANVVSLLSTDMEGYFIRRHQGVSLDEAIRQAALMCATNPARVTGLLDGSVGRKVGAVEAGFEADLVVAEIEAGDQGVRFSPREVYLAGRPMLGRSK